MAAAASARIAPQSRDSFEEYSALTNTGPTPISVHPGLGVRKDLPSIFIPARNAAIVKWTQSGSTSMGSHAQDQF